MGFQARLAKLSLTTALAVVAGCGGNGVSESNVPLNPDFAKALQRAAAVSVPDYLGLSASALKNAKVTFFGAKITLAIPKSKPASSTYVHLNGDKTVEILVTTATTNKTFFTLKSKNSQNPLMTLSTPPDDDKDFQRLLTALKNAVPLQNILIKLSDTNLTGIERQNWQEQYNAAITAFAPPYEKLIGSKPGLPEGNLSPDDAINALTGSFANALGALQATGAGIKVSVSNDFKGFDGKPWAEGLAKANMTGGGANASIFAIKGVFNAFRNTGIVGADPSTLNIKPGQRNIRASSATP